MSPEEVFPITTCMSTLVVEVLLKIRQAAKSYQPLLKTLSSEGQVTGLFAWGRNTGGQRSETALPSLFPHTWKWLSDSEQPASGP